MPIIATAGDLRHHDFNKVELGVMLCPTDEHLSFFPGVTSGASLMLCLISQRVQLSFIKF